MGNSTVPEAAWSDPNIKGRQAVTGELGILGMDFGRLGQEALTPFECSDKLTPSTGYGA
jgi:hypothetical protein